VSLRTVLACCKPGRVPTTADGVLRMAGALLAGVLLAAGCDQRSESTDTGAGSAAGTLVVPVFDCGEVAVMPTYEGDVMTLTTPDGVFPLVRVPSASGAKYEGADASFWEHQGRAMVTLRGTTLPECTLRGTD